MRFSKVFHENLLQNRFCYEAKGSRIPYRRKNLNITATEDGDEIMDSVNCLNLRLSVHMCVYVWARAYVYVDVMKAFDKVLHSVIWQKLRIDK